MPMTISTMIGKLREGWGEIAERLVSEIVKAYYEGEERLRAVLHEVAASGAIATLVTTLGHAKREDVKIWVVLTLATLLTNSVNQASAISAGIVFFYSTAIL